MRYVHPDQVRLPRLPLRNPRLSVSGFFHHQSQRLHQQPVLLVVLDHQNAVLRLPRLQAGDATRRPGRQLLLLFLFGQLAQREIEAKDGSTVCPVPHFDLTPEQSGKLLADRQPETSSRLDLLTCGCLYESVKQTIT